MTVLRVIPAVVVNSVERFPALSWFHVINEVGKTLAPSIANGNAATSVILKLSTVLIRASLNHFSPTVMGALEAGARRRSAIG